MENIISAACCEKDLHKKESARHVKGGHYMIYQSLRLKVSEKEASAAWKARIHDWKVMLAGFARAHRTAEGITVIGGLTRQTFTRFRMKPEIDHF